MFSFGRILAIIGALIEISSVQFGKSPIASNWSRACYLPTASSDAKLLSCRRLVREGP